MAIPVSEREGVFIFRLNGRIMAPSVREIVDTVAQTLTPHDSPPKVVFDFKKVTAMDSAGLGALMEIHAGVDERGGEIAVINVNKHVRNLIVMARLITVFRNFESENDAVKALLLPSA